MIIKQSLNISCILFLLLFGLSLPMLMGCHPNSYFVISDDASIIKLNEIEKGRHLKVTTCDRIYVGENIKITRDSTTLEDKVLFNFPTKDITRIQVVDSDAMITGIAAGTMGGAFLGLIVGYAVGSNATTVSNSGRHHDDGTQSALLLGGSCGGGLLGMGFGVVLGEVWGKKDDIHITYSIDNKSD